MPRYCFGLCLHAAAEDGRILKAGGKAAGSAEAVVVAAAERKMTKERSALLSGICSEAA